MHLFILVFLAVLQGLMPGTRQQELLLQGFGSKVAGNDFSYSFPVPGVSKSLLVRATDGLQSMEWLTEPVPDRCTADTVTFAVPVAIGCNSRPASFFCEVDGQPLFDIVNEDVPYWQKQAPNGVRLSFEGIFVDSNRDRRGFLYLSFPKGRYTPGQPVRIKITGQAAGVGSTWLIVYQAQITPSVVVSLSPGVVRGKQQVLAEVVHFGRPLEATLSLTGGDPQRTTLRMGLNTFFVQVDKVTEVKELMLTMATEQGSRQVPVRLEPSPEWKVYFVQHTHTDIGYTRSQTEILAEHIRFIDYALDYCDATDALPADAQFRWTCENSWAVEEFLKTRPQAQIDRLRRRVAEGRIEITGMIFNFSELPDEASVVASLKPLDTFKAAGLPVEVAMQNDVNGIAWELADLFPRRGVKYLNMGTHGHRALICFDVPTVFRWQALSGQEMIAYRAEHYCQGNFLGIEKGDFPSFEVAFLKYLRTLHDKGYPWNIAAVQFSGYFTDNSPPSVAACEMVRQWNEKYDSPKIRLAVSSEFIKEAERLHYAELPVIRGAWCDWWTDGCGAAAREVAAMRGAQDGLLAADGLMAFAWAQGLALPPQVFEQRQLIRESLLFYAEHTTGSSESVRDPFSRPTMDQRAIKDSYAWEAQRRMNMYPETAKGLLQAQLPRLAKPSFTVYNTLNWARSGLVTAYIDYEVLPLDKAFVIRDTRNGRLIKAQPAQSRTDGTYWQFWVEDVPPLGAVQYEIDVEDRKAERQPASAQIPDGLENEWYRLTFDKEKGVVTELYDKELRTQLLDPHDSWSFGEFIYERLAERTSMEAYTMGAYTRTAPHNVHLAAYRQGPIFDSFVFEADTDAGMDDLGRLSLSYEFRMYHTAKQLTLHYELVKKSQVEPEAIYIAFPLGGLPNARLFAEVAGGPMEAGVDQLKGSSNDWNAVQTYAAMRTVGARNAASGARSAASGAGSAASKRGRAASGTRSAASGAQVVIGSAEIPLMQMGAINTGRYKAGALPESTNLYSWVMNNYWTTNFNAEQRGAFAWSYYLTSMAGTSPTDATRFAWGQRVPMPVRVLPAAGAASGSASSASGTASGASAAVSDGASADTRVSPSAPLFTIENENVLLVSMQVLDDGSGVVLQLRETEGKSGSLRVTPGLLTPRHALTLRPYGTDFLYMDRRK